MVSNKKKKTKVQSLVFDRKIFKNKRQVKKWVVENGFKIPKFKKNPIKKGSNNFWRVRQRDPWRFKRLRTITLKKGVKAVVGILK